MPAAISRRDLFDRFRSRNKAIRPPWSVDADGFVDLCSRCDACVEACPQRILVAGPGGFPVVDSWRGACTFCGACAAACTTGALRRDADAAPWSLVAGASETCLQRRGVTCRLCEASCEVGAIGFRPALGGRSELQIAAARCTGCGGCIGVCPTGALALADAPSPSRGEILS